MSLTQSFPSPGWQFWIICALLIGFAIFVGGLFALLRQQFNEMQRAMGGPVVPLWRAALAAAQALLTHPHEFAREADELMRQALEALETGIPMNAIRYARLEELLFERMIAD